MKIILGFQVLFIQRTGLQMTGLDCRLKNGHMQCTDKPILKRYSAWKYKKSTFFSHY